MNSSFVVFALLHNILEISVPVSFVAVAVLPPNIPISSILPTASPANTRKSVVNSPTSVIDCEAIGVRKISLPSLVSNTETGVFDVPNAQYFISRLGGIPL